MIVFYFMNRCAYKEGMKNSDEECSPRLINTWKLSMYRTNQCDNLTNFSDDYCENYPNTEQCADLTNFSQDYCETRSNYGRELIIDHWNNYLTKNNIPQACKSREKFANDYCNHFSGLREDECLKPRGYHQLCIIDSPQHASESTDYPNNVLCRTPNQKDSW